MLLSDENEQKLYAKAWEEIETQNVKKGAWAKAFADAGGDEDKTKSNYLALRVQRLKEKRDA